MLTLDNCRNIVQLTFVTAALACGTLSVWQTYKVRRTRWQQDNLIEKQPQFTRKQPSVIATEKVWPQNYRREEIARALYRGMSLSRGQIRWLRWAGGMYAHWGHLLMIAIPLASLFLLLVANVIWADARPTNPGFDSQTIEILSYQSSSYRYKVTDANDLLPLRFEQPSFDDSSWKIGKAAFGVGSGTLEQKIAQCGFPCFGARYCALQRTVNTYWEPNSKLLVRKVVQIPAGARMVRILMAVDNDVVGVFFNGTLISGYQPHEDCPIRDEFRFDIPQSLIKPGNNLIALQLQDRGVVSFFDMSVLAEQLLTTSMVPVCTPEQIRTWEFINNQQQGIAGRDTVGHHIGPFSAERTFLHVNTWYPVDGDKETLCGELNQFNFYHSFWAAEDDWNNYFKPQLSHQQLLFGPLQPRLKEWDSFAAWHRCNGGIPVQPSGTLPNCMEAELEPEESFEDNHWFPRSKDTGAGLGQSPLKSCNLCTYGAWVQDCWHDCRPEIHPSELIWWEATPQGTCVEPKQANVINAVKTGNVNVHYLMLLNDDSSRFDSVDGFEFGSTPPLWWHPWAADPRPAEFRFAFRIIGPANTATPLTLSVQQLDAYNVVTSVDPLQRKYDSDTQLMQELTYNGKAVVQVTEQQNLDKNVGVRFVDVCRNGLDTVLQGYVSLTSSIGEAGHHVMAIVSRSNVLDISPPQKPLGLSVVWTVDANTMRFSRDLKTIISDLNFKTIQASDEVSVRDSVASVYWGTDKARRPIRFESDVGRNAFRIADLPVFHGLELAVNLVSGTSLTTTLPGLAFVPFTDHDDVVVGPSPIDGPIWTAMAIAAGGLSTPELTAPLRVDGVRTWHFEAIPYYAPLRDGEPSPEDESAVSEELNRAILDGSADRLERLFGIAQPFTFRWVFYAVDATTGEPVPVVASEDASGEAVGVVSRDGRFPNSILQVTFPKTNRLIKLYAVASATDTLGNEARVEKIIWSHILAAESSTALAEGLLPVLANLSGLPVEEFINAATSQEVGKDDGFVSLWVSAPSLAAAQMARTATQQSAFDQRITVDELAQLVGVTKLFMEPGIPDRDRDGISDFIDLCPVDNDQRDSDRDSFPDCLDNCPQVANPDQQDTNTNGKGDACDSG